MGHSRELETKSQVPLVWAVVTNDRSKIITLNNASQVVGLCLFLPLTLTRKGCFILKVCVSVFASVKLCARIFFILLHCLLDLFVG